MGSDPGPASGFRLLPFPSLPVEDTGPDHVHARIRHRDQQRSEAPRVADRARAALAGLVVLVLGKWTERTH